MLSLAILAALGGAMVTSSAALARRTLTSFDRLSAATQPADALVFVNGGARPADAVAALPGVESSWTAALGVAGLNDENVYLGMIAGTDSPPPGLVEPLIVTGRAPRPDAAVEVMVSEEVGADFSTAGIDLGDVLPLRFLTREDYWSFDTGFEDPGGPQVDVRLVGTYQIAGGSEGAPPMIATPGLVRAHPDALAAGYVVALRLSDGEDGIAEIRSQLNGIADDYPLPPRAEEFNPFQLAVPSAARQEFDTTARVLGAGLAALAAVAALVTLVLLAQGFNRYHSAANEAEATHAALGLTSGQILATRLVAAVPVAVGAAALVLLGGGATAGLEPLGSLRAFEPHPGRSVNWTVIVGGAAVTALVVLTTSMATMAVASRRERRRKRGGEAAGSRRPPWPVGRPAAIGIRFNFGRDRSATAMRSAIVGVAIAVLGVAAGLVFATSLDRLVSTPARYGWGGELSIVDADAEAAQRLVDDPAVAGATRFTQSTVRIGGDRRVVTAYEDLKGAAGWWVSAGVLPTAPDQVALEARLADQLGAGVGDDILAGPAVRLRVVGVGVGPNFGSGPFGEQALVTPAGAERVAGTAPFTEIVVDVAPGHSVDEVEASYLDAYEMGRAAPPAEIRNLAELGRLPELLTAFLAVIGLGAMANALWVSVRRRRRDLAVLRVLGHTPRQTAVTVVTMSLSATVVGVAIGLPLGIAIGRTAWRLVAESSAVGGDALLRGLVVVGVPLAAFVVALLVAAPAAWFAARRQPGVALRAE